MIKKFFFILKNELKTLRNLIFYRLYVSRKDESEIVASFHKLYFGANYFGKTYQDTFWMGVSTLKCPLDLWVYQEIIYRTQPDLIIECGTYNGGSALYLASIFDLTGKGRILTIDIQQKNDRPKHPRIQYLLGSSTAPEIVEQVHAFVKPGEKVMVILDSNHEKNHVFAELKAYHGLVTKDCYLIVEDTCINGHPIMPEHGPGPMEALDEFFKENHDFLIDKSQEKFFMTFNPKGFLKKIR